MISEDQVSAARSALADGCSVREAARLAGVHWGSLYRLGIATPSPARRAGAQHARGAPRVWSREAIIEAIRAWNDLHGAPPTANAWNPTIARRRSDTRHADGDWPVVSCVLGYFPTWRDAIRAAGFPTRPRGHHGLPVEP